MALLLITTSNSDIPFQNRIGYISRFLSFKEHMINSHGESIDYLDCKISMNLRDDNSQGSNIELLEIDYKVLFYADLKLVRNKFFKSLHEVNFGHPILYNIDIDRAKIEYFKLPTQYISDKILEGPLKAGKLRLYNFEKEKELNKDFEDEVDKFFKGEDLLDNDNKTDFISFTDFLFKKYEHFIIETFRMSDLKSRN